ncbi:ion transporter [bacterium]|nr:MAG: ion transporter [bacterium]
MKRDKKQKSNAGWRGPLYQVIFEHDTSGGKLFDVILISSIIVSVIVVMLDSVNAVREVYGNTFYIIEWFFTILFTVEYILRLLCIGRPLLYATSFFGVVDLIAVIPTYLSLLIPGSQLLLVIRVIRILRVFRVLKLIQYIGESQLLMQALRASHRKIIVFLFAVLTLVIVFGSIMYVIEGEESGFTSIPRSVYWAIVTLTTVGYGDISPKTSIGQMLAAIVMIMGYGIIAVPTGIITAEYTHAARKKISARVCSECSSEGHSENAVYCKDCGTKL